MVSTVGPSPPSTVESIPTVDLRLLSQSELTALSLCSSHSYDLRRCDDVVIPKIDRTVFNESAGSRKQTYSRLRLAPRNNLASPPQPPPPTPQTPKLRPPLDSENSRIISIFKRLFNSGDFSDDGERNLVNVNVEYSEELLSGSERKRKARDWSSFVISMANDHDNYNDNENEKKEKDLVNKKGEIVDLEELGKNEDPYGEEMKKRTEGRESAEELLGFVWGLEGEWGSTRKKRKIVDANIFGDCLPNGWKLLIAIKKKQGRAWLFCRRYIRFSSSSSSSFFFLLLTIACIICYFWFNFAASNDDIDILGLCMNLVIMV